MSNISLTKNTPSDKEYELYDEPSTAYELDFVLLIDKIKDDYIELVNISERVEGYLNLPLIKGFVDKQLKKSFEEEFKEWLFSDTSKDEDLDNDWDDDFDVFLD